MAAVRRGEERDIGDDFAVRRIAEVARLCRANGDHLERTLEAVLEAAIELTGADRGNIQLLDPSGALVIAVQRGFEAEFLTFFARVDDTSSACGLAMYAGEQIVLDDVETSDVFAGSDGLGVMLRAGARAVQSTPLIGSAGKVVGMISTHFAYPRRPTAAELAAVSLLAGLAADHLAHADARRSARWRAESLNTLLEILPIPAWISFDPECREIRGNAAALAMFGVPPNVNLSQTAAELGEAPVIPHYQDSRRLRADELPMQRAAATRQPQRDVTLDLDLPNGERGSISGGAAPLFDDQGEVRGVVAAFADITVLRRAEQAREVMARELLHRGANLLMVVQALTRLSFGGLGGLTEAYDKLERRLQALARANRLLAEADHRGVNIRKVIGVALDPFTARFEFDGEDAWLSPTHVQNLSIALHELGTNAIKYGALSNGEGVIGIQVRVENASEPPALIIAWRERSGPPVEAPIRAGQGTRLLRTLYQDVSLDYAPSGLRCELRLPIAHVSRCRLQSRFAMAAFEPFANDERLTHFLDRLRVEADPERRKILRYLAIAEEDRYGQLQARLDKVEGWIREGEARIARQRQLVARFDANGRHRDAALRFLSNLEELQALLIGVRGVLRDADGRTTDPPECPP